VVIAMGLVMGPSTFANLQCEPVAGACKTEKAGASRVSCLG
jgi:hypothetical protein